MAQRIQALTTVLVLIVLAVLPAWSQEEKPTASRNGLNLVGTYHIVAAERNGQPVPMDHFRGHVVQITPDQIRTLDKDKKEILVVSYKIDPSTTPCRIATISEMPIKNMKNSGLIEKNGDTIRLICAMPGGQDPTTFKTANDQQMFVLKCQGK
jgi:uncharacterized protein (TIGR03067 family)